MAKKRKYVLSDEDADSSDSLGNVSFLFLLKLTILVSDAKQTLTFKKKQKASAIGETKEFGHLYWTVHQT